MELDFNEIRELLAVLSQSDISELSIKSEEFELTVRKDRPTAATPVVSVDAPPPTPLPTTAASPAPTPAAAAPAPQASQPTAPPSADSNVVDITSPMVGTFYRAPSPDDDPFVNVGDRIKTGQVVCILEAMKLMNELEAEVSGEVVEILVENADPVEYGQVLMRVRSS
ncbi:MAG: acetyl-CoA carboxylase biotin carboxyl carrier protein [Thainema sp.]